MRLGEIGFLADVPTLHFLPILIKSEWLALAPDDNDSGSGFLYPANKPRHQFFSVRYQSHLLRRRSNKTQVSREIELLDSNLFLKSIRIVHPTFVLFSPKTHLTLF